MTEDSMRSARRGGLGGPMWPWAQALLMLVGAALFAAGFFTNELVNDDNDGTTVVAQPSPSGGTPAPATATPPPAVAATVDDDPFTGPEDAPVTLIEFSDYEWPYCKRFRDETLDQILETYEGKVKHVFRDFPLSFHPWAQKAAEAAECADDQGEYWAYHDVLFEQQDALNTTYQSQGLDGALDSFKSFAADLGLDSATFDDCLDSGKYTSEVQADLRDGQAAGVTGTPGFSIGDVVFMGAIPFEDYTDASGQPQKGFKTLIAEALQETEG